MITKIKMKMKMKILMRMKIRMIMIMRMIMRMKTRSWKSKILISKARESNMILRNSLNKNRNNQQNRRKQKNKKNKKISQSSKLRALKTLITKLKTKFLLQNKHKLRKRKSMHNLMQLNTYSPFNKHNSTKHDLLSLHLLFYFIISQTNITN